ncbi:unnamed protein product [marine sediment metagenome]|uniref:Uncharacterized protein n=1 Tax=marine sediment metagenome TaxID=412755 RepID=X0YDU1_9ZZZZ
MPLHVALNSLDLPDAYEVCYKIQKKKDENEEVCISAPNKEDAKELFTFALIEMGLKEAL